jgi:hypothetical protein
LESIHNDVGGYGYAGVASATATAGRADSLKLTHSPTKTGVGIDSVNGGRELNGRLNAYA